MGNILHLPVLRRDQSRRGLVSGELSRSAGYGRSPPRGHRAADRLSLERGAVRATPRFEGSRRTTGDPLHRVGALRRAAIPTAASNSTLVK